MRRGGCELHHLHAALNFAFGIRQNLAAPGGNDCSKLVGPLFEDAQKAVENAGPAQRCSCGQPDAAAAAVSTAARTSSGDANATRPLVSPVAGLNTAPERSAEPMRRLPPT